MPSESSIKYGECGGFPGSRFKHTGPSAEEKKEIAANVKRWELEEIRHQAELKRKRLAKEAKEKQMKKKQTIVSVPAGLRGCSIRPPTKTIAELTGWTGGEDDVDSKGEPISEGRATGAFWHSTCASGHYQTPEEQAYDTYVKGLRKARREKAFSIKDAVKHVIVDGQEYETFERGGVSISRNLRMVNDARDAGWDGRKENTVVRNTVTYEAVEIKGSMKDRCKACHLCNKITLRGSSTTICPSGLSITCMKNWRYDGRDVVWKKDK